MPTVADALDALRATLPPWFGLAPLGLVPLAFVAAWLGAFLGVSVGLLPLRGVPRDAHWTERARRAWPARVIASGSPLLLGICLGALAGVGTGPLSSVPAPVLGGLVGCAGFAGAWTQLRRTDRLARGSARALGSVLGGQLFVFLTMIPHVLVVLVAAAVMPADPLGAMVGSAIVLALLILVALGYGLRLAVVAGLARPADERLARVVEACSARVGVRPRRTWIVRWPMVNALAFPRSGELAFTEDAVASLDDAELDAIAAHELGHLGEPAPVVLARSLGIVALFPIALVRPVRAATADDPFGSILGVLLLVLLALVVSRIVAHVARRMEERADAVAHAHEEDPGAYARALERVYQLNLAPAVSAARKPVHPHLYDRLVAAGSTPDYPRPAPPPRVIQTLGLVIALFVPVLAALALGLAASSVGEPSLRAALRGGSTGDLAAIGESRWRAGDLRGAAPVYEAIAALEAHEPFWASEASRLRAALGECDAARAEFDEAERRAHAIGDDPSRLLTAWSEVSICVPRE